MKASTSSFNKDPEAVSNFLCFAFFIFGICQLIPWNVFIKSAPYYGLKMSNSRWAEGMGGYISFTFTGANFAGMVFWVLFAFEGKIMDARGRVITGMTGSLICLSLLGLLTWIDVADGILFPSLMILAGVSGLSVSLMTKGLFNIVACLPPRLTAFLIGGQAFAGLLVSLINILCVLVQWDSNATNSFEIALCFFIGTGIVACADMIFFTLFCLSNHNGSLLNKAIIHPKSSKGHSKKDLRHLWDVFRSISGLSFGITSTLAATICIYATFVAATSSAPNDALASKLRIPFLFAMYDFGDLLGRALPTIKLFTINPKSKLLIITPWIRWVIFLPIFCFFPQSISPIYNNGTIGSDIPYVLLCFIFALSNGYLCSVLIMSAPIHASRPELMASAQSASGSIVAPDEKATSARKEVSGSVMGLFLNLGLVTGAMCSLLLTQLVD